MTVDRRPTIQAIHRAAHVLGLLDGDTRTLTAALVADRLGLNRTTAHRYLQSLQRAGFLGPTLGPGPLLDQLAALASVRHQILVMAPAILRQLAHRTGLTSVLSVLGQAGAVVTHVEEARPGPVVLTVRVGTVLEPRAAQTRALLAFHSDPAVVARVHASLLPWEAALERDSLMNVRMHRLAWADLGEEGVTAAAVPIFSADTVYAAMALIGTTTMLPPKDRRSPPVRSLEWAARALESMVVDT